MVSEPVAPPGEVPDYSYMSDEQLAEMCVRLESSHRWMNALLGQLNDEKAQLLERREEVSGEILKLGGSLKSEVCPSCSSRVSPGHRFCPFCGTAIPQAGTSHTPSTAPEDGQAVAAAAQQKARARSLTPVGVSSGNEESPCPGSRRAVEWMRMDQWCRNRLQAEEAARAGANSAAAAAVAAATGNGDAADGTAENAAGEKVPAPVSSFYARRVAKAQAHAEDCMQRLARAQEECADELEVQSRAASKETKPYGLRQDCMQRLARAQEECAEELEVQSQAASKDSKQSPAMSSPAESSPLCGVLPPQSELPGVLPPQSELPALPTLSSRQQDDAAYADMLMHLHQAQQEAQTAVQQAAKQEAAMQVAMVQRVQQDVPPRAAQVAASRPKLRTLGQGGVLPGSNDTEQASLKLLDQEVQRQKEELELAKRQLEEEMAGFAEGMEARQRVVQACHDEQFPWKRPGDSRLLQGTGKRLTQKEDMDPQLERADMPDEFEKTIQHYRKKAAELEAGRKGDGSSVTKSPDRNNNFPRSPLIRRSDHLAGNSPKENSKVPLPLQMVSSLESVPGRTDESTSTMATTPDVDKTIGQQMDVDVKRDAPHSWSGKRDTSMALQPAASLCRGPARTAEGTSAVTIVPNIKIVNSHIQNVDVKHCAPSSNVEMFWPSKLVPSPGSGPSKSSQSPSSVIVIPDVSMADNRGRSLDSRSCTAHSEGEMLQPSQLFPGLDASPSTKSPGAAIVVPDVGTTDNRARSLDIRNRATHSEREMLRPSRLVPPPGSGPSRFSEKASTAIVVSNANLTDSRARSLDIRNRATHTAQGDMLRPSRLVPVPGGGLSKAPESPSIAIFIPNASTADSRARSLDARTCATSRDQEMFQLSKLAPSPGSGPSRPAQNLSTATFPADVSMTDGRARSADIRNCSTYREGEMFRLSKLAPSSEIGPSQPFESAGTATVTLDISMTDSSARSLDVRSSARHSEGEVSRRPQMAPSSGSSPVDRLDASTVTIRQDRLDASTATIIRQDRLDASTATITPDVDTRLGTVYERPLKLKYSVNPATEAANVVASESATQVRVPSEVTAGPLIPQNTQRSAQCRRPLNGSGSARRHLSAEVVQVEPRIHRCNTSPLYNRSAESPTPLRRRPSLQKSRTAQAGDTVEVEGPQINPLRGQMPDRRNVTAQVQPPNRRVKASEPLAITVDYAQTGTMQSVVPPRRNAPHTASQAMCVTAQRPAVVGPPPSRASTPSAAAMSSTRPLVASGVQQQPQSRELSCEPMAHASKQSLQTVSCEPLLTQQVHTVSRDLTQQQAPKQVNLRATPAPPQRPVATVQARSLSRESSRSLALSNPPPMFTNQGCLQQPSLSRESTRSGALSTPQSFPQQPAPDAPAMVGLPFPASTPGLPGAMPLAPGMLHTSFSSPSLDAPMLEAALPREATHDNLLAPLWLGLPGHNPKLTNFEAPPPPRTAPASQAPYGSIATLPGEDALGTDPLWAESPPPPRSAPAAQDINWDSAPETARDRSRHLGEHLLRVQTADDRWESLAFSSGDDLPRSGATFLQQQGLKRAFHAGLIAKMRQMIAAGESYSSVDVVDLI